MSSLLLQSMVSLNQYSMYDLLNFFQTAEYFVNDNKRKQEKILDNKTIATLFFQPSTRTRLGFTVAATKLGAQVISLTDINSTRLVDYCGETLSDCIRVVSEMSNCIILRHFLYGCAKKAAEKSLVPLINAGDGSNEHPSQAMNDLWLIYRSLGGLTGTKIGIVGDPNTRVLKSLIIGLAKFKVSKLYFLLPPNVLISDDIKKLLLEQSIKCEISTDIEEILSEADALEIMPFKIADLNSSPNIISYENYTTAEKYKITRDKILKTKSKTLILHPGPRQDELNEDTDNLKQSLYFLQVRFSIYMRMAILKTLLIGN